MKIYLAAPLFTQAECKWNRELAEALRMCDPRCEIVLPQDAASDAVENGVPNFRRVFDICLHGIFQSDLVVAILDGSDSDSGTCFECGYAFASGKPVLGVRTDVRASEDRGLNAMLSQSCVDVVYFPSTNESVHQLAEAIVKKLKEVVGRVGGS